MLQKNLLPVSVLLCTALACGSKKDKNEEPLIQERTALPLNTPDDLVGAWKSCDTTTDKTSTGTIYIFSATGGLLFKSMSYLDADCKGDGTEQFHMEGTHVAGTNNTLDMTLNKDKAQSTVYRVFSVQGDHLKISNNIGFGADADHRDVELNDSALNLTKMPN